MKWITRAMALAALFTISAVGAWAQTQECTDEFKTAKYQEWFDNRKENQDVAYKAAKDYVAACPTVDDVYAKALKKFIKDYDDVHSNLKLAQDFEAAVKSNNYAQQVQLGKQITAANPDGDKSTIVYIYMANAGMNDASVSADSMQAAKKAIELIEAGKPFAPAYPTKDQALAAMNFVLAKLTAKNSPGDAIPYFIKAAKYDSPLKKDVHLYNELSAAYAEQVDKLTKQYEPFIGKPETPESKLVLANLNAMTDAYIDALARAAAVADAANRPAFMERLTAVYKTRRGSDTGLNELVAGIMTKPLPDQPKPITELPTTPSGTPTPGATSGAPAGSSSAAPSSAAPSSTAKPATTTSPAGTRVSGSATGTTGGSAKPASSPSPKPRPRRSNHRP